MPKDNYVKPTYGDNNAPGGGKVCIDRTDKRFDDFSTKWQKKEEERKKQNQSSSQGSSKS